MNTTPNQSLDDAEFGALCAIVQHWLRWPAASDSSAGIGRFWLGEPALGEQSAERVLAVLEKAGFVQQQHGLDGRVSWRRDPARTRAQLRQWMEKQSAARP